MDIETVGVVGADQMGNGIAQVAVQSGLSVIMCDAAMDLVEKGKAAISKNRDRQVKRDKISKTEKQEILGRVALADSPESLADLTGPDTCLAILEVLHQGLGEPKCRPCPFLKKYVDAEWFDTKTGKGFHDYSEQ